MWHSNRKGGGRLKIEIHVDEQAADMEISVTCKQLYVSQCQMENR